MGSHLRRAPAGVRGGLSRKQAAEPHQRTTLALHHGQIVSVQRLVDSVWSDNGRSAAVNTCRATCRTCATCWGTRPRSWRARPTTSSILAPVARMWNRRKAWCVGFPAARCDPGELQAGRGAAQQGPVWTSVEDGSSVTAAAVASSPVPIAIPQVLLRSVANRGPGLLGEVTFVQRLNTTGGLSPTGACKDGATASVPYTADYTFWVATPKRWAMSRACRDTAGPDQLSACPSPERCRPPSPRTGRTSPSGSAVRPRWAGCRPRTSRRGRGSTPRG